MASPNSSPSNFPPAMGPGGRPQQPGKDRQTMVAEIVEMRKNYSVAVEATTLKVSYLLDGARRSYEINWDSAPLSGFQKWLCYGGRGRATISGTFLLDMLRGAENMTGRPLTQKEAEAFTLYSAKRMTYGFLGTVVALGSGYGLAWRGAKQMKFPFKKVKPLEAYDAFPLQRMPLLKGQYARSAWQVTRANIYAALGLVFLSPLFRGMGESVMAVGLYRDDRTRETVKSMKGGFDRIRMNRGRANSGTPTPQQTQQSQDSSGSDDFYARNQDEQQSYYGKSTDYAGDQSFTDNTTDTGTLSDRAVSQRESQQSSPAAYGETRYPQSPSKPSSDFFFDDASPTAGNDPNTATSQPRSSGSAWDRIRQGGQPQQKTPPSQSTYQSSQSQSNTSATGGWPSSRSQSSIDVETKGDSFSFSASDSNRALAKEQAQKEFDAMLDKERRESGSEYDRGYPGDETGSDAPSTGSAWGRRRNS